jgi:hypothetical protein
MRDQLANADQQTARAMAKHADVLWDDRRGDSAVTALETSEVDAVLRIRIRIHMFLCLLDPDPDPLVSGMDPDP